MRLLIGTIAFIAVLVAMALWMPITSRNWLFAVGMASAGFRIVAVIWGVRVSWRNRQRRRLADMRDSALW